jgi:DNA-binding NtrC family response regulator
VTLPAALPTEPPAEAIVARSPAMRRMLDLLQRVAPSDAVVRITGESGAGKGFVARLLHRLSRRAGGPFVEIACANLPESLFESELFGYEKGAHTDATQRRRGRLEDAAGGTVLFDAVEELAAAAQAKLLRALQERAFERLGGGETVRLEARLLATSSADLDRRVREGTFRSDLYHRFDVVRLEVPPLRDRRDDIQRLATLFLRHHRGAHRLPMRVLTERARRRLVDYTWPGNVRELRNVLEHAILSVDGREIDADDLRLDAPGAEAAIEQAAAGRMSLKELEAAYIERVLRETGGNRTRAAAILGISRKALLEKRRRYGLE